MASHSDIPASGIYSISTAILGTLPIGVESVPDFVARMELMRDSRAPTRQLSVPEDTVHDWTGDYTAFSRGYGAPPPPSDAEVRDGLIIERPYVVYTNQSVPARVATRGSLTLLPSSPRSQYRLRVAGASRE